MALSLKHFLLLILFAGFALAALMNSERTFMIEFVKLVTFGTLVVMAYGAWASAGETRAYCAGFLLWGKRAPPPFEILTAPGIFGV